MRTVLIADDEENIREGLRYICDWDKIGFSIEGEAANGEDALSQILDKNPSVVLMDLHMPRIHGIDVIRMAREKGYKGRFIILSGYSDFSYAQSAIRYGVTNYMTKPIDEEELEKTVLQIKEDMEKEEAAAGSMSRMRTKAKDVIVSELLLGKSQTDNEEMATRNEIEAVGLLYSMYQVVTYETYHTNREAPVYHLTDLMGTIVSPEGYEESELNGRQVILLKGRIAADQFANFVSHYDKRPLQEDSPLDSIFLTYGRIVDAPEDIHLSYEDADKLCRRRFYWAEGTHTIGRYDSEAALDLSEKLTNDRMKEYSGQLVSFLQAGSTTDVEDTLIGLDEFLHKVDASNSSVRLFLTDLFLQVRDQMLRSYPECADDFDGNADIIDFISNRFYLYEIIRYFKTVYRAVLQRVRGRGGAERTMADVMSYIDHNYAQSLTLESVAPLFGYNSVYLGKVFSKMAGTNFNTYLNEKRIEEAKKLLSSSHMKIYEIATKIGYNDVDYFSKKFRAREGMSPADYRRGKGKENIEHEI